MKVIVPKKIKNSRDQGVPWVFYVNRRVTHDGEEAWGGE